VQQRSNRILGCSNHSNYNVYLDIIAASMVTCLMLSQLTSAPALSQSPKSISHVKPLDSHSCIICTHKPFRITFLRKNRERGGSIHISGTISAVQRTDRIGAESKGPLWD